MILEFQGEYRWLSNFWPVRIEYEGVIYASVEHAYQAQKCALPQDKLEFSNLGMTAGQAKRKGREVTIRPDWNRMKVLVMKDLTRLKYQDPELRKKLLATGFEPIVEGNNWGDEFWGVNLKTQTGNNYLGELIMKERDRIREGGA